MGKKSELSVSQRVEVVLMILRKEEPISVLARRFGVSENTLHRWKDDFVKAGQSALTYGRGKSPMVPEKAKIKELERDLAKRDQVIGELTIANRILKKSADGLY
jgi:transposase-like protein